MVITALTRAAVVVAVLAAVAFAGPALAQQSPPPRVLKMQSAVPASSTTQDAFRFFADRVDKLTGGQLKIEALPGGAIVPPFEILDATHKKVIDGAYGISYWWFGKNKAATLFANTPAGIAGMDAIDFIGWVYDGGGLELWNDFYQKELKLNLVAFPSIPPSPQAMGWFKRPIKDLADFKGMKCRQTGIVAELYSKMGMAVVNMPGGEILPAAERGTIDCAEWVGGVEDQRLGLHTVWKYHYTPGMHESASVAELAINKDVWDSLPAQQKEAIKSATSETFLRWWATWQRHERGRHRRVRGEAQREAAHHAARGQQGVPQGVGRVRGGRIGQEPVLQEGLRVAARLCVEGRARQALHVPALHLPGGSLLAGQALIPDAVETARRAAPRPPFFICRAAALVSPTASTCGSHRAIIGKSSRMMRTNTWITM